MSLKLPRLIRTKFIRPGQRTGPYPIGWTNTYTEERIAAGLLTTDLTEGTYGWTRIQIGELDQTIHMIRLPRPFGGGQWYFLCPYKHLRCSVLWKPLGARSFGSRQTWARQLAYSSQFLAPHDRALAQAQSLRAKLGGPSWAGIDEMDPPKPKGMRWRTYERIVDRSRLQEARADQRMFFLMNQWARRS